MKLQKDQQETDKLHPINIQVFESLELNQPFHYHTQEYELTLILGGKGIRLVGDHISTYHDADLCLVGPGIPHTWINYHDPDVETEHTMVISIQFNRHLIGEDVLKRMEFLSINKLLSDSIYGIEFQDSIKGKIASELMKLKIEPDFYTTIHIITLLNELSETRSRNKLCSSLYHFSGKKKAGYDFEKVFSAVQLNYLEKIWIHEVSDMIGMNESAFSHFFKKRTGKSFTDFVNELRLNHASLKLRYTEKPVADICFESGFNNLSNFNRIFKKWADITPLQWRKSII